MLSKILKRLVSFLPSETVVVDDDKYLTRYYVLLRDWRLFNIYIHHFHSSDPDDDLHNHPWAFGLALILAGGYREEYRVGDNVCSRFKSPGQVNVVKHDVFHRVELADETNGSWSLFIAGPRKTEWGFWNRNTKKFCDWHEKPGAIP